MNSLGCILFGVFIFCLSSITIWQSLITTLAIQGDLRSIVNPQNFSAPTQSWSQPVEIEISRTTSFSRATWWRVQSFLNRKCTIEFKISKEKARVQLKKFSFVGQCSGNRAGMVTWAGNRWFTAVCVCQTSPAQTPHYFFPPSTGPFDSSQPDLEAMCAAALESRRTALFIRLWHTHTHGLTAMIQTFAPFRFLWGRGSSHWICLMMLWLVQLAICDAWG